MTAPADRLISTNGQPVTPNRFEPVPVVLSCVVPAVADGQVGYLDRTTVGTALAGLAVGEMLVCNPEADLVAAGAGGGYINCRVSAPNTIRMAFIGALAGGAANFIFKRV